MPKRTFWLGTGITIGSAGSLWLMARAHARVERLRPERVRAEVADSVRTLGRDVVAAIGDGRDAMARREAALRSEIAASAHPSTWPGDPLQPAPTLRALPGVRGSGTGSARPRRAR